MSDTQESLRQAPTGVCPGQCGRPIRHGRVELAWLGLRSIRKLDMKLAGQALEG